MSMALSDHFKDIFKRFDFIEAEMNEENAEKMFNVWSAKYASCLKAADERKKMEMISRSVRARREMMTSAYLWAEALTVKEQGCISAYYFLRYYSLFHAMWSVLFLNPEEDKKLVEITHSKLKKVFCNYYANYDYCAFNKDLVDFFESTQEYRETYSYNRPNNLIHIPDSEEKHEKALLICYQLTNLFTSMLKRRVSLITINSANREMLEEEFAFFNGHKEDDKYVYDPFEENILYEMKKYGMSIIELEEVLGHDWDELGYNSTVRQAFDEDAVDKIKGKAISFIFRAVPFA